MSGIFFFWLSSYTLFTGVNFYLTYCEPLDGIWVKSPWCKVICVSKLSRIGISDGPIKSFLCIKIEFSSAFISWRWRNSDYKWRFWWRIGARCYREVRGRQRYKQLRRSSWRRLPHCHRSTTLGMKDTRSSMCSTTFHKWHVERMIIMLPTSA